MPIEKGAILEGTVVNITAFGAFVEFEGKTGLVHISEVADTFIKDIKDVLKLGDKVKVKILNIDEQGKISLSIKQASEKKPEVKEKSERPERTFKERDYRAERPNRIMDKGPQSFEDMMSRFQKDSEERVAEYKRRAEAGGNKKRRS